MYDNFKNEKILLSSIKLDDRNPRIVSPEKLKSEDKIIEYLFEYDGLADFVKIIATEGKNIGAERPFVVKSGKGYVVIEGNTRLRGQRISTAGLTRD